MYLMGGKPNPYAIPLLQAVQDPLLRGLPGEMRDPHGSQRPDHCYEAQRIHEKTDPLARDTQEEACYGGPNEPCAVKHERVEGNGVSEIFSLVEHITDERLPGRDVKGGDGAHADAEHEDVPDSYVARKGEQGQNGSLYRCQRLDYDEQPQAVPPVGKDPCKGGKQKGGELAGKADEAEEQG